MEPWVPIVPIIVYIFGLGEVTIFIGRFWLGNRLNRLVRIFTKLIRPLPRSTYALYTESGIFAVGGVPAFFEPPPWGLFTKLDMYVVFQEPESTMFSEMYCIIYLYR